MGKYPQLAIILFLIENRSKLDVLNNRGVKAVDIINEVIITSFLEHNSGEFQYRGFSEMDSSVTDSPATADVPYTGEIIAELRDADLCLFCSTPSIMIEYPSGCHWTDAFCSEKCASRIRKCITCRSDAYWSIASSSHDAESYQTANNPKASQNSYTKSFKMPKIYNDSVESADVQERYVVRSEFDIRTSR